MADSPPSPLLTRSDLPDILSRYAQGESLNTLAADAHKSRVTIYNWMLAGIGPAEHEELVTKCLVHRVVESDEKLEYAQDSLNVARAREMARFARMDLERRRPQLYGPKQETKTDVSITVVIQRLTEDPKTTIIESEAHEQTED